MAPHSSTLAWKIPWMEEPGRLQSMGSLRVGHNWVTSLSLFTFHFHALEKEMATHSSVLAWRIPGAAEPDGLLPMGSNRVGLKRLSSSSSSSSVAESNGRNVFGMWQRPFHSWASHFFPVLLGFFCFLLPLNFTLKLWLVWMWNSRRKVAKTTEFHTGSTWKKYSIQPCSKLGPSFAKSFMNVTEPGFET